MAVALIFSLQPLSLRAGGQRSKFCTPITSTTSLPGYMKLTLRGQVPRWPMFQSIVNRSPGVERRMETQRRKHAL